MLNDGAMRVLSVGLTTLLVAVATPFGAREAVADPPRPAPPPVLTVDPTHGPPTAALVATLQARPAPQAQPGAKNCPLHGKVIFRWDGTVIGERDIDERCMASLLFAPPLSDRDTGP